MKKGGIICTLVLIGMFLSVGVSVGQPVDVNCPTDSLQTAINVHDPNQTFNVTGTCSENITISEFKEKVTIQAKAGFTAAIVGVVAGINTVTIWGQGVTVKGFTISGGFDGILVAKGGTATIDGNTIQNVGRNGITVALSSYATIINNTITGNPTLSPYGRGINVSENSSARIGFSSGTDTAAAPNTIQNHASHGIEVERSATARIVGNIISSNDGSGIVITRGSTAAISNNTINDSGGQGIYVGYDSLASLGNLTGSTIFDLPNSTTHNNAYSGLACSMGATVTGRLGTLNGNLGPFNNIDIGITTSNIENHEGINIRTGASPVRIAGNGNVGIGTKTASRILDVSGGVPNMQNAGTVSNPNFYTKWLASTNAKDDTSKVAWGLRLDVVNDMFRVFRVPAFSATPTHLFMIDGNGSITSSTGAFLTAGGHWADASSREYKENIKELTSEEAIKTLAGLTPVKYNYKTDKDERHVGFVAEDVPDLVAMKDRKGLSPMDIVAVLTKVMQEQQKVIQEQQKIVEQQQKLISAHSEKISELERALRLKGTLAAVK